MTVVTENDDVIDLEQATASYDDLAERILAGEFDETVDVDPAGDPVPANDPPPSSPDRDPVVEPYWQVDDGGSVVSCPLPASLIAGDLGGHVPAEDGTYHVRCPAGGHPEPSVVVWDVPDDGSRMECRAGCDGAAIGQAFNAERRRVIEILRAHSDVDRSSWWPRDLTSTLAGQRPPPPDILCRTDGAGLLYRARINEIFGASGEGKTYLAIAACAERLVAGAAVMFIDFEDHEGPVVTRLLDLGVDADTIHAQFTYIRPDEPLQDRDGRVTRAGRDLAELLTAQPPDLATVDGVTEALSLFGLDPNYGADIARFKRQLLDPLVRAHAAVLNIDHVTKSAKSRGGHAIGSQHKRAIVTGASYEVSATTPFARGVNGLLKITCRKDKGGGLWQRGQVVAEAHMITSSDAVTAVELRSPRELAGPTAGANFQPTSYMAKISRWLQERDEDEHTKSTVREGVGGKVEWVDKALALLVERGHVTHRKEGNANRYRHLSPFRDDHLGLAKEIGSPPHEHT